MSEPVNTIMRDDLQAYVDGKLNDEHRRDLEAWLVDHPVEAVSVAEWRQQNAALRTLYDPVALEPVPERLQVRQLARSVRREPFAWRRYAAAAVILAVGVTGGWFARDRLPDGLERTEPLVTEAIQAHRLYTSEVLHPVEVRAEDAGHLRAWLSKRLDRALAIPDLRAQGLTLVGGRLLPAAAGPAAQFMYESQSGQRLTLYIEPTPEGAETAFLRTDVDGLEAFYWRDETIRCAIVGDVPRERLQAIATAAYRQLS